MAILLDSELCKLCAKLYDPSVTWPMLWDEEAWGLQAAKTTFQETIVVIHRGSETPLDWFDDLVSEAIKEDPELGSLPLGFAGPLRPWYEANKAQWVADMVLLGHSLGAARAVEMAGMLTADGMAPRAVVVWGEPKAGMKELAQVLKPITVHSYRNRHDPVPTVPVTIGLLEWTHGHDVVALDAAPLGGDSWGLLADHHIELYIDGMAKLNPQPMV